MTVLVDAVVVAAVLAFVPVSKRLVRARLRRAGHIPVDLAVVRTEHAAQVLADAASDPELEQVLRGFERDIEATLATNPGWANRGQRRVMLTGYASGVLEAATGPGPRPPSPYRGYGHTRLVLAATVRLVDRSRRAST